jgi:putative transposase
MVRGRGRRLQCAPPFGPAAPARRRRTSPPPLARRNLGRERRRGLAARPCRRRRVEALFRPQERRQTRRGEIQLFSNRYFSVDLEAFHGLDVLVSYDIHDARRVWVSTLDQRLICEAAWHGNSVGYFPRSVMEQAHERRVDNQVKRAERRVAAAAANRGVPTIELSALAPPSAANDALAPMVTALPEPSALPPAEGPRSSSDFDLVAWIMADPERMNARDARYLLDRIHASANFRLRLEVDGIDPAAVVEFARTTLAKATTGTSTT